MKLSPTSVLLAVTCLFNSNIMALPRHKSHDATYKGARHVLASVPASADPGSSPIAGPSDYPTATVIILPATPSAVSALPAFVPAPPATIPAPVAAVVVQQPAVIPATPAAPVTSPTAVVPAPPTATATGASSAPTSGSPPAGTGKGPTQAQFNDAVAAYSASGLGTPPVVSTDIYNAFISHVSSTMSFNEQAQFMANAIWETGGLQYMKEIACSSGTCTYGKYYGRGFLQITWDYNYKAASKAIYGDENVLLNNPDQAATPEGAWQTALWFWNTNVHSVAQPDTFKLGYSVNAINGGLECTGGPSSQAQKRLAIYNAILKAWGISGTGTLDGCSR